VVSIIDKSIAKQSYIITKQGITSFIKAFSPGTTYLRATHGDYSAQIKVTVKAVPITSISDPDNYSNGGSNPF
jgi:hypothetical protein